MVLAVVHAFVDVHQTPFVAVVVDIQLVDLEVPGQAGMDLAALAANTDAGNLDS